MGLVMLGRQKYIQQSHYCLSRVPLIMGWLLRAESCKSPGTDQVRTEMIKVGRRKFPLRSIKSIIVPVYGKGYNKDYNNYKDILLLSSTYKILSNILLS